MFKKITFLLLLFPMMLQAQIEAGKMGEELITALQSTYTPSSTLGYGPARDILYSEIDNVGNDLFGIYTNFKVTLDPTEDPSVSAFQNGAGINAEHVYPQSKGAASEPQKSDLHNIFPSKVSVNESRGSCEFRDIEDSDTEKWFFEATQVSSTPTSNIDAYSEKDEEDCGFEPRESIKGDIARAVFYFYTIYRSAANGADPNFFHNQKEILYQWHLDDPVDAIEEARNNGITDKQGNSNPFILDATLVQRAYFPTSSTENLETENWVSISTNLIENDLTIFSKKENGKVLLYSGVGYLVKESNLENETNLDLGGLTSGIYILQIQSGNLNKVFRIFKK
ncbi:MAG: endonuclease [Saprospiraceae bacterium]